MCGCRTDEEVPWTVSRSPMTASIPGLRGFVKHSPRRARLPVHTWCSGVGGGRRCALPRHLRTRRLQPRDDDPRRPAGAQRGSCQPAELAGPPAAHRGRGRDPARRRRAARLPPRARHPACDRRPPHSFSRSQRQADGAAEPPVRQHGRPPPCRDRVDTRPGELVWARRGGHGDRRPGQERRRRPLPAARRSPPEPRLPADVRA
jgi:hypothetical protein